MYYLQYSYNDGKDWICWREMEESEETKKSILRDNLEHFRRKSPYLIFRYIKTIEVTYKKNIIIS